MKRWWGALVLVLALALAGFVAPAALRQLAAPAVAAQASTTRQAAATSNAALSSSDVVAALEGTMETVYQNVSPSVVYIEVTSSPQATGYRSRGQQLPQFQVPPQQGSGSGFVWDKQGNIVTNNHVVEGASSIQVTFSDGTTAPATLVGADANSDLAVIKVSVSAGKLQPVTLADSTQVKVGQVAIAIGNPFGLESTMTVGYVSGLGRSLPTTNRRGVGPSYNIPDLIQTDAPINPGNSGGVLLNSNGEVLGVTNAIASNSGSSSGVGFAIPASTVAKIVPTLISGGKVSYSWLGISGGTLDSELAKTMNLDANQQGVLVAEVTSGGPAEKAGLKGGNNTATINGRDVQVGGDVITAIDGHQISNFEALTSYLLRSTKPGQQVSLTILRDGKQQDVAVTLGERPTSQPTPKPTQPAS